MRRAAAFALLLSSPLWAEPPASAKKAPGGETVEASVAKDDGRQKVMALADKMRKALRRVKSAQCTFYKKEYKGGPLEPAEATLKNTSDGKVYLRFHKGPNEGRDILFRPGENDGKVLVSNPVFNLNLEPDNFLAMRTNRHTVASAGMHHVARRVLRDHKRLKQLPDDAVTYKDLGRKKVGDEWASCYRAEAKKDEHPELYSYATELCVGETIGLPVEVKVWQREGGEVRQVGYYRYTDCEVNKLRPDDFDPDHTDYRF